MNTKRVFVTLGMALAACCAVSPAANAQSSETIEVFTRADLTLALDAIGAIHQPNGDNRTIDVAFENGLFANAALMACDDDASETNCYATSILAQFTPPDASDAGGDADARAIADAINEYNYRQNFGRAYLDPEGRISVRLYIISDGGIRRENYLNQIRLWETSLGYFTEYLYPSDG